jgi:RHS repeat-associated protein
MIPQQPAPDVPQRPAGRAAAGHPIDIASGIMFNSWNDFRVDGHVTLTWDRTYSTGLLARPPGLLGPGWTATYLATLEQQPGKLLFRGGDGGDIEFAGDASALAGGGMLADFGAFASLSMDAHGAFVVTRWFPDTHNVERLVFVLNADGTFRLRSVENMVGQAIDLEHDTAGRLLRAIQRRERRAFTFGYDRAGRLSEVTAVPTAGSPALVSQYRYDDAGRLIERRNGASGIERFAYDKQNRMVAERTLGGCTYRFEFDAAGRCTASAGDGGFNGRKLTYHAHIGWTEVTDSTGAVWRYNWIPSGQVIQIVSPLGAVTRRQFDSLGRPAEFLNPRGGRMIYRYDGRGDRTAIINTLGDETRFRYNQHHQLVAVRNAAGDECYFDRPDRRLAGVRDFAGNRAFFAYNDAGDVSEVRDPNGHVTRYEHNASGDFTAWITPRGQVSRYNYDGFGRMTDIARPDGSRFAFVYDALGHVRRCTRPDGGIVEYDYSPIGRVTRQSRPDGHTTSFSYGSCGRLREAVDELGRKRRFKWSSEPGKLLRVEDDGGTCFGIEWDADGRPISFDLGSGLKESMTYDLGGCLVLQTNAAGEATSFDYDAARRLTCKRLADGTEITYGYDVLGSMVFAHTPQHKVHFRRDHNGRVVEESQGDADVVSTYDGVGNRLTRRTNAGHQSIFSYNADDDLDGASVDGRFAVQIMSDAQGRPLELRTDRGCRVVQEFDGMGRLTSQSVLDAATHEVAGRKIGYDTDDRPVLVEDVNAGRTVLVHDALGRTGYVGHQDGSSENYSYDDRDRLLSTALHKAPPLSDRRRMAEGGRQIDRAFSYADGTLESDGHWSFAFDAGGRMIARSEPGADGEPRTWCYEWSSAGWLAAVTDPDGQTWHYSYDAFGRRVTKEGPDGKRLYVWDGDLLVQEIPEDGPARNWVFAPDDFRPLIQTTGRDSYLLVNDWIGTPREAVDAGGRVGWRRRPTLWGEDLASAPSDIDVPLRFQGQWQDPESGLVYNRFRYYDPTTGRYLSPDPIATASLGNLHGYPASPTATIDPFGLDQSTQNVNGRTYTYDRDSDGRVTRAEGPLCNPNTISDPQRDRTAQRNLSEGTGYDAGHLLGNQFGGPGGGDNLVLMCPDMNRFGSWKRMENELVDLTRGNSVRMAVNVHYDDDSPVPSKFTVDAEITDRRTGKTTRRRWTHTNCC